MKSFKERCIELRGKDYTLPEIVKITGRPKTSVYFHIRNIPLSEQKQRAIRAANSARALQIALRRKGKSSRSFRKFARWDRQTVFLVAHLLFDGEVTHYACIYNNRSMALMRRMERSMKVTYDYAPFRYQNKKTGVFRISYYNVALAAYIEKKAEELLQNVVSLPRELKRVFLQAFFDDEGCIDYKLGEHNRMVRGYQRDMTILKLMQQLLLEFGIAARIQLPNEVVISRKENLLKFQKEINFSPGVRMNGKRTNSTWKKNLEKREILKRAVRSYL